MRLMEENNRRFAILLVLALFAAQIFVPLAVAQAQSEGNETTVNENLSLSASASEYTSAKAITDESEKNEITFVLGTDESLISLENASMDATVNATIEVIIYNATEAKSANFSNESVVFLASLDNETVASINQTINESAYVMVYNLTTNISIGTVEDINITKYWVYGGDENIQNLINYIDNKFCGNTTAVDPPKVSEDRPKIAFVHSQPYGISLVNRVSNDPFISDMMNVTTYFGRSNVNVSFNLSGQDVILLCCLTPAVVEELTKTVNDAKNNNADVIAISLSEQSFNLHNVNLSDPEYSDIKKYLEYPSEENTKRLLVFIGVKFCNVSAEILPPISRPIYGIYHPYAPEIFTNTTGYFEWYNSSGRYNPSNPTVGIVTGSYKRMDRDSAFLNVLIESFESRNVNAIVSTYTYHDPNSTEYLMEDGKPVVDSVIIISRGSRLYYKNASKGIADLQQLNVTALNGIRLFYSMTQEEWEAGPHGLPPIQSYQVAFAELDGIIEPIVICGKAIDPITEVEYNKPIDYQINWLTNRTISWMRLHRTNNSDKKIVIPYYSAGGGKANVGSDIDYYLDAQASLTNLLVAMKERGYDLGTEPLPNKTELAELMAHQGSNFGTWAPGELNKRVQQGNVILIPKSEYLDWFDELPENKRNEMIERWGTPPGEIMVFENETGQYLVIPKIQFGNVLLAPDPTWGWLQNESVMYYNGSIPPTHQCLAFYLWLKKEFGADAIFAIFTSIEAMPGKECGLSAHDWGAILIQDMPLIHVLPMDAEGIFDRRRANMLIVDFMTPTIVPSGLYGNLSSLQQEISFYNQAADAVLKERYRNKIMDECRNLSLDRDLEVDLNVIASNTTVFEGFLIRLSNYLQELKTEYMPYGSHTLSEPPTGDSLVALVEAMLGDKFKHNVSVINSSEGVTTRLLTEVLLNDLSPEDAQNKVLGTVSLGITQDLNLAAEYANRIAACTIEIPRILDALEGKYIPPGPNGDPIRNPDALPTGRDLCTFDERLIPTEEAWEVGKDMADHLLAQRINETGKYPRKTAFLLWSIETSRHQGIMESEIFYLLGVKPIWDKRERVKTVELISSSELGRPRIDVVVTTSGSYRDMYSSKIKLIDKAVRLAAQSNDTEYPNYVKEDSELIYRALIGAGYNVSEARSLSMARIFSPPPDSYTPGLQNAIPASDTWGDTEKLAELYIDRMSYVYGEEIWGEHLTDLFTQNLNGVEVSVFSRSSNVYGVLDHPMVATYFGGLSLAVKSVSGKAPDMYINNLREPNNPRVETLSYFLNRELRTRYFNPKWIEGMMEHGYDGTRYMAQFTEDLWMWDVVTPDLITTDMWNQVYDVYIQDKYNRGLKDFFGSNNPYAQQSMTARMLEAIRKGYWSPSEDVKTALAETYQKSVEEYGVTCCHHTCANLLLQDYMQGILSVPGEQSKEAYHRHGGGGARRITEEEIGEGLTNMTEMVGVSKEGEELKKPPEKASEKKGKVMKEEKPVEKPSPAFPISGAPLMGILAVIVVLVLIGIGLGLKRRKM